MKLKNFGFIALFMVGFILYSMGMWGLVIANLIINMTNVQTTLEPFFIGLIITVLNPMSSLAIISQLKLAFNDGTDKEYRNIATIWGAMLLPVIVTVLVLLLSIFY